MELELNEKFNGLEYLRRNVEQKILEFAKSLKNKDGDKIPGLEKPMIDTKDIIVVVVNYFKQNTDKPLCYDGYDIKDINNFNEIIKKNIEKQKKIIINVFTFMFSFYEKIYNKKAENENTSDIHACYTIEDYGIVSDFVEEYLSNNDIDSITFQYIILELVKQQKENPKNIPYIVSGFVIGFLSKCCEYNKYEILKTIIRELVQRQEDNAKNISYIIGGFVIGFLSRSNKYEEFKTTILELVQQQGNNLNNIFYIVGAFVRSFLSKSSKYEELKKIICELVQQQQRNNPNNISYIINAFAGGFVSISNEYGKLVEIILELVQQQQGNNPNNISYIIGGFVIGFVSEYCENNEYEKLKKYEILKTIIRELVQQQQRNNPNNIFKIVDGFVQSFLSISSEYGELKKIICELVQQQQRNNPKNIYHIIGGFVIGFLSECCEHNKYEELKKIIFELIKQQEKNPKNIFYIVNVFVQVFLSRSNKYEEFKTTILELIKQQEKNTNNIPYIVDAFVGGFLLKSFEYEKLKKIIFELIKQQKENPKNIFYIVNVFVQVFLSQDKDIYCLESFFIGASELGNISIEVIYNFIYACVIHDKCQLNSENVVHLIKIIEKENNKNAKESKIILCGMYVSNYLLKLHNKKRNESVQLLDVKEEFINLLDRVFKRNTDNSIEKIEDLTIKEIKILFNSLMSIKFNKTKKSVNGNNISTGPFLQIIISLAENSGVGKNTTIYRLFNKINDNKIDMENIAINNCQKKLNNFGYVEITNDTKIDSIKTFLEILKLKDSDFNKECEFKIEPKGFKTFLVNFPGHTVTIVVDMFKTYKDFLNDNKEVIKDIIMIDSSRYIQSELNKPSSTYLNSSTLNFIGKIPVNREKYQKNETCWANTCCAISALLNNYRSFINIVEKEEITKKILGLEKSVEKDIINETGKYFLSNVEKMENKNKYLEIYDQNIIIITNFDPNKAFQNAFLTYEAQEIYFKELETEQEELEREQEELKNKQEKLENKQEKSKKEQKKLINELKGRKREIYHKNKKLEKCIERLKHIPKFIVAQNNYIIYDTYELLNNLESATKKLHNSIQNSNNGMFYFDFA